MDMKDRIVPIGNSQGIRIPKPLLREDGLSGEVEIGTHQNALVTRSIRSPRADWKAAFAEMAARDNDSLLDGDLSHQTAWDEDEWQW